MNIEALSVGAFATNCYIAWGDGPKALVIDPGSDAKLILEALTAKHLTVAAYLLTHGHVDHVSALADMCLTMPAPVHIHPLDFAWTFGPLNQIPPYFPIPRQPEQALQFCQDGQDISAGGLHGRVIFTPGHTPGSVCFLFPGENILFSGDTLFAGSVGRTDLPGGDSRLLSASLATLATLSNQILVYPGHGPATDMAYEKRSNFFLR